MGSIKGFLKAFLFFSFAPSVGWGVVLNSGSEVAEAPNAKVAEEFRAQALKIKTHFSEKGGVQYQKLKDSEIFKEFQKTAMRLKAFDLSSLKSKSEKMAFWINIYNSLTIHGIMHYEIKKSVREISNFFTDTSYEIGGHRFSLDDIENGILRANRRPPYKLFKRFGRNDPRLKFALTESELDPRLHFALNCGSTSCPPFSFYTAERLETQLSLAATGFINADSQIKDGKVYISKIFDWYSVDFTPSVKEFLLQFAEEDLAKALKGGAAIKYSEYNWNLNSEGDSK